MYQLRVCGIAAILVATLAGCSSDGTPLTFPGASGGTGAGGLLQGGAHAMNGGSAAGGVLAAGGSSQGGAVSSGGNAPGGSFASGGATASGGKNTAGGTPASGGAPGGASAVGGNKAAGGASVVGGSANAGGATALGGKANSGGSSAMGGKVGTGGSSGGTTAAGGKSSVGGAGNVGGTTGAFRPCPTDGTACKIMPFGDSITDGYNGDTPGGYRVELFRLAHSAGKNITFVGENWNGPDTVDGVAFPHNHQGHSGWSIYPYTGRSGISTKVATVMKQFAPHIVLLMIGTNDAIDNHEMANAPTRLSTLIDSIYVELPNVTIIVAQPIPSRGDASKQDDTSLSARLKTYGDAIPAVVKAKADAGKHISVVDMYAPFNGNKASLLEDQWHPNLAGYVILGAQWYSVLQPML